jgi:hypothetical protein
MTDVSIEGIWVNYGLFCFISISPSKKSPHKVREL